MRLGSKGVETSLLQATPEKSTIFLKTFNNVWFLFQYVQGRQ